MAGKAPPRVPASGVPDSLCRGGLPYPIVAVIVARGRCRIRFTRSADGGFDARDLVTLPVARAVTFTVDLPAGSPRLATIFTTADGRAVGCYYVVVTAGE